jgi:hypothetical protein
VLCLRSLHLGYQVGKMDVVAKKDEGNRLFADGSIAGAIDAYTAALSMYHAGPGAENAPPTAAAAAAAAAAVAVAATSPAGCGDGTAIPQSGASLLATLHSNLAACYLRTDDAENALKHAEEAIAVDPAMTKVRGCAAWNGSWACGGQWHFQIMLRGAAAQCHCIFTARGTLAHSTGTLPSCTSVRAIGSS